MATASSFAYYNNYDSFYQHQYQNNEIQIVGKNAGINNIEIKIANKFLPYGQRYILSCTSINQPARSTSNAEAYYYGKYLKLNLTGLTENTKYRCQIAIQEKRCDQCGNKFYQYGQTKFFFISTKKRPQPRLQIHSTSSRTYRSRNCCGSKCRVYQNPYVQEYVVPQPTCQQQVTTCTQQCITTACQQQCEITTNCQQVNTYTSPFLNPTNTRSQPYRINTRTRNYYYY
jgi:hypothetical protein